MAALIQIPINFSELNPPHMALMGNHNFYGLKSLKSSNFFTLSRIKAASFYANRSKLGAFRGGLSFLEVRRGKVGLFFKEKKWNVKNRVVLVRFNGLPNGGGGGGRDTSDTLRVLSNLALAIVLTYLTFTGKLGWILDAIVSIWLLAGLLPIVGIGAFLWWASRDILQGTCPNCGNDFQVFKSALDDDLPLCPFCSQPFSVVGDEFVRDPVKFSNQPRTFDEGFDGFTSSSKKGKNSSATVVDVEAEIRDVE